MPEDINQATPAAEATDNVSTTVPEAAPVSSESVDQSTTPNPTPPEPTFNPKTTYDSLVKQLESVNKNYGSLRSEFTRRTQHEAELKNQIAQLSKAFTEATRQEISPAEFMQSLQTQGLKAFEPLRQQWTKELSEAHQKALEERDSQINKLEINQAVLSRKLDTENYPDFTKLMPVMQEIGAAEDSPIDWNQDIGVIYDTLYKLARDLKAEESVKKAHELGRQKADAQSAKEAGSAVAAGGKTNTTGLDTRNMKAADLRKHFEKLGMVSD